MIENLLNYGHDATESHRASSLYFKDSFANMGAHADNAGYQKRLKYAARGEFDCESNIHSELFNQNKYLLNGVQMVVKFIKAKNEFALITKPDDDVKYKIKITEATLIVRKVKINPAVVAAHSLALQRYTAKYPITRVDLKNITIPKGVQDTFLENFVLVILPTRVIIGFVDSQAFN